MGKKIFLLDILEEFKKSIELSNDVEIGCNPKGYNDWYIFRYEKGLGIYVSIIDDPCKDFTEGEYWGIDWKDIDIDGDGEADDNEYINKFIVGVIAWLGDDSLDVEMEYIGKIMKMDVSDE